MNIKNIRQKVFVISFLVVAGLGAYFVTTGLILNGRGESVVDLAAELNSSEDNQAAVAAVISGDQGIVVRHFDVVAAQSVEELTESASVIVVGRVTGTSGVLNMTRDSDDHSKPDADRYSVGRIYDVEVSDDLKGKTTGKIQIVQYEGSFNRGDPELDLETIADVEADPSTSKLVDGQEYVMFLSEWELEGDYYYPSMDPYRFAIVDGEAISEGNMSSTTGSLPSFEVTELLSGIRSK